MTPEEIDAYWQRAYDQWACSVLVIVLVTVLIAVLVGRA